MQPPIQRSPGFTALDYRRLSAVFSQEDDTNMTAPRWKQRHKFLSLWIQSEPRAPD